LYSRSNDLTDRHADKVLADKALGRVTARDSALSERAAAAAVWAAMKAKIKIGMKSKKKTMRKKATKKWTSNSETRRTCVIVSANVRRARILDRRSGQRGESGKNSKAARRQLEELQRHNRAMEQGFGKPNSIESLLGFSSKRILRPRR